MQSFSRSIASISVITLLLFLFSSCNPGSENRNTQVAGNDSITDTLSLLSNAIIAQPQQIEPYLERALYYAHKNMQNEALADINAAMDIREDVASVYIALSEVYLYGGKTQRALDALKKAVELEPDNAQVDVASAKVYLAMQDYNKTFASLRTALAKNPENAEAFFISGLANEEMGDTIKAIDSYQSAVARNNKHYDALKQLGILFSIKRDPLGIDYLRNASTLRPKSAEPLYVLGMHYQENGEPDKALSVYQEIIQIDSTYKLAHYNTGYVYLVYKEEYDKAADAFSRALYIDPEYADALYNRGLARELMGDITSARSDYEQVLRMRVNDDKAVQGLNRLDRITGK